MIIYLKNYDINSFSDNFSGLEQGQSYESLRKLNHDLTLTSDIL